MTRIDSVEAAFRIVACPSVVVLVKFGQLLVPGGTEGSIPGNLFPVILVTGVVSCGGTPSVLPGGDIVPVPP